MLTIKYHKPITQPNVYSYDYKQIKVTPAIDLSLTWHDIIIARSSSLSYSIRHSGSYCVPTIDTERDLMGTLMSGDKKN